jgi:hypothetical protein
VARLIAAITPALQRIALCRARQRRDFPGALPKASATIAMEARFIPRFRTLDVPERRTPATTPSNQTRPASKNA